MAPPKKGRNVDVDDVLAAAKAATKPGGRSAVYGWLWDNFDALKPEIDAPTSGGQAWWDAFAVAMAAKGLTDGGRGAADPPKAPTGATARQTWWKVVRDRERWAKGEVPRRGRPRKAAGGPVAGAAPAPSPAPVAAPVAPPAPVAGGDETKAADGEVPRQRFGPARVRR